ncbi:hypothetical protein [Pseudomonas sp. MWU12-2345]|uniref:hypothetical protein n=1 Tax=Pseudomonas sp. MWU12-2345 TaxID=2928689 RepID=UPI0020102BE2|nr:hypothetical protein [Pseudomonas sp. MWU12-2345]
MLLIRSKYWRYVLSSVLIIKYAILLFVLPSFLHPNPSFCFFVIRAVARVVIAAACLKSLIKWRFRALKACLERIFSMPEKHGFPGDWLEPLKHTALSGALKINIHFCSMYNFKYCFKA